jgi:tRNA(Ile)-lysidine synthase TilS/MesJ
MAAIAVSGGPDSMALCLLAKHWWQQWRESGIFSEKVTGIVVDHGLRPESGAEALQVQHWVQNLGEQPTVLHSFFSLVLALLFQTFVTYLGSWIY